MTIQEKAKIALKYIDIKYRNDGTAYVAVSSFAPKWLKDLIFEVHLNGDILPDEYRYHFLLEAVQALAEQPDDEHDDIYLEADISTPALLDWLSSNLRRITYCNDAMEEGLGLDFVGIIARGQEIEKAEVLVIVREFLEELVLDDEDEEDDYDSPLLY